MSDNLGRGMMRNLLITILATIICIGCGDQKFSGDDEETEGAVLGNTSELSFISKVNEETIKGEIIQKGNLLNNHIPITISNQEDENVIRFSILNHGYHYFKSLRKVQIIDDSIRGNTSELDFSVNPSSDELTFTVFKFQELMKDDVIKILLKFDNHEKTLNIKFRDRPAVDNLIGVPKNKIGPIDEKYELISILGEKHQPIKFYKIKNIMDEPIRVDISTASAVGKLRKVDIKKEVVNKDCTHTIKEEKGVKDYPYYILPINKGFVKALGDIRSKSSSQNTIIELLPEETILLGIFVKLQDFNLLSGEFKSGETYGVEASISCSYSCRWSKFQACQHGDRYKHRQVKLVTAGNVNSSSSINLENRILAKYSVENQGAEPTVIKSESLVFEKNYTEHERVVKRGGILRLYKSNSYKCNKCTGGSRPDIPN